MLQQLLLVIVHLRPELVLDTISSIVVLTAVAKYIYTWYIYIANENTLFSTTLGSAVALCGLGLPILHIATTGLSGAEGGHQPAEAKPPLHGIF